MSNQNPSEFWRKEPWNPCPEPRCEREKHEDPYGHWYTVFTRYGNPSHPVQWGHKKDLFPPNTPQEQP